MSARDLTSSPACLISTRDLTWCSRTWNERGYADTDDQPIGKRDGEDAAGSHSAIQGGATVSTQHAAVDAGAARTADYPLGRPQGINQPSSQLPDGTLDIKAGAGSGTIHQ